jgi:hypothetical protein
MKRLKNYLGVLRYFVDSNLSLLYELLELLGIPYFGSTGAPAFCHASKPP